MLTVAYTRLVLYLELCIFTGSACLDTEAISILCTGTTVLFHPSHVVGHVSGGESTLERYESPMCLVQMLVLNRLEGLNSLIREDTYL